MAVVTLTPAERLMLTRVLDLSPALSRKHNPTLQPLSFYSSELKGTKQIAGTLEAVDKHGKLSENEISRARYFNSLSNQGLIEGSPAAPKLTALAAFYLHAWKADKSDQFWQGGGSDGVELEVIRVLAERMRAGQDVSDAFKAAWFNAQTFFDSIPPSDVSQVLQDRARLLSLFRINSNGWEIARYYRLSPDERKKFDAAFEKVQPSDQWAPSKPIEIAAAQYKDAAKAVQADVRFRISGFLNAYNRLRSEFASGLPRLDRQLVLRAGTSSGGGAAKTTGHRDAASSGALPYPHQLIVTGCPGSGKSYYVDQIIDASGCVVFRTQFHPESSYFDFVGAYKPQPVYEPSDPKLGLQEGDGSPFARGRPLIDYRFVPGPLASGLAHALLHPDENVVVLIEEINRGNAAAIFGDALQLLDRDESGQSRYSVLAPPDVRAHFAGLGHSLDAIRLPANLYLWATMNSADQGVFPLDTAFRRRWNYVYKGYTEPCLYAEDEARIDYAGETYSWDAFRGALNDALVDLGIHEDKLIGPYFLTPAQLSDPGSVLEKLFLYLWDDVLRFRQESLFAQKSFSLVGAVWANGKGNPLNLKLPPTLKEAEDESDAPKLETSAPDVDEQAKA